ncbi:M56 family metallopeptidase [Patiriisocius marinus]|uniref:Cell envelope biogenesis protein TonB n=1 Tax=Patiriisocius marinus TaxID=1397112 RepID=A0A5J4IRD7_9FLAO|nr:M56 family metallopeptidase [Patiriisocius marinus]GER60419.1 cell envelope biogenesis protein TonB [Patiriisocius marinus]
MAHYIIQVIAFQLLFLVTYDLFLKKETFFQWNRVYLIATSILSFGLPFIKIGLIQRSIPQEYMVQLPAVLIGGLVNEPLRVQGEDVLINGISTAQSISVLQIITALWIVGMVVFAGIFAFKIAHIRNLKRRNPSVFVKGVNVVTLQNTDAAFSFFGTIYLGENISEANKKDILLHEEVHINQHHSIDLLFFEIFKIVCWFNPLSYVFQKRLELLHEYIADSIVATKKQDTTYYQTLLSHVFNTENVSFVNTFFNKSLIKKRIIMLQKSKSKQLFQLKYLALVPLVFGMLIYTSCSNNPVEEGYSTANFGSDSDSEIIQNIERLKESIAKKGYISEEEELALKAFTVLTSSEGVDNIHFEEVQDLVDIPFGVIEKVPAYPGCSGTNEEMKDCMTKSMSAFIGKNFDINVAPKGLTGVQKIYVQFKIDTQGKVVNVKARAPHEALKEEAIRVVSSLPTMKAGEQSGKKVSVLYSLPIKFEINE